MSRRIKKLFVTSEAIKGFMNLPDKTEIYDITRGLFPDTFIFYLEHPDFEELREGEDPPTLDPSYLIKDEIYKKTCNQKETFIKFGDNVIIRGDGSIKIGSEEEGLEISSDLTGYIRSEGKEFNWNKGEIK